MTFDDNEAKKFAHQIIQRIEALTQENVALKTILKSIEYPGFQEQWENTLKVLIARPEANQELHAKFLSLYERADRIVDAATALEVLKLVPDQKQKAH